MYQNNFCFILLTLMLTSCLKSYEPVIKSSDAGKYVVSGQVNNGDAVHRINVSIATPIYEPTNKPVAGCTVKILDDKGNSFATIDMKNGNYEAIIPKNELKAGTSFKADVILPGGDHIVSDFDQIQDCPDVDSVYYVQKEVHGLNPGIPAQGIQFYLNLNGTNITCRNFMFEAFETWEYHSAYPIEWYYNGYINHRVPPDFSRMVCWKTSLVKNFFTLTTRNQSQNTYTRFPLHIVNDYSSPRLQYGYSLLIRQYTLSDAAFIYWEKIQLNSNQEAGLYERQPQPAKGNMHNLTNPDQEVLGLFGATTVKSKRIFVGPIKDLPIKFDPHCEVGTVLKALDQIHYAWYPAYLFGDSYGYQLEMIRPDCVDCLRLGGINVKPDFWPN
jgi:hypothetical protein